MKLCSALKFTANATLSVSKLQPQNNNNINDNNSKIKIITGFQIITSGSQFVFRVSNTL